MNVFSNDPNGYGDGYDTADDTEERDPTTSEEEEYDREADYWHVGDDA
jgi:hypothetical protein